MKRPEENGSIPNPSDSPRVRARNLPRWKKIVFSLVVVGSVLFLMEAALWIAGVRPIAYDEDPYVGFASYLPLFVEDVRGGETTLSTAPGKIALFNPQAFTREKPSDTFRIFCVGGSTTYGRPYTDATSFAGWLRRMLPLADSSRNWEVINAGGISYASYRVARLMDELVGYDPDLFIVYTGHNEFLEKRTYADLGETSELFLAIAGFFSHTRIYSLARRALRGPPESRAAVDSRPVLAEEVDAILDETVGPSTYTRNDALRDVVLQHFRFNLVRIVELARSAGASVLFVTPVSNLEDCTPFKSSYSDTLPEETRLECERLISRAAATGARDAIELLDRVLALDPRHAGAQFRRARALAELGREADAESGYRRARDEDVCSLRALSSIVDSVRSVAAERGVALVDFEAIVARDPALRFDRELFLDHVHLTVDAHGRLAEEIVRELARDEIVRPEEGWEEAAVATVEREIEQNIDRAEHAEALKNVAKVFAWAGKFDDASRIAQRAVGLDAEDAETHFVLGVTAERAGALDRAQSSYERAVEIDPEYAEAHKNLGRVAGIAGRWGDARAAYERALSLRAEYVDALEGLAHALDRLGAGDEALAKLREALRIDPGRSDVHARLGLLLRKRGELPAAEHHLREAARISPDDARAHSNLAIVLDERGNASKAREHYQAALRLRPDYVVALDNYANLFAREGNLSGAIDQFAAALRYDPEHAGIRQKLDVIASRLRRVLAVKPADAEASFYLGLAERALGDDAGGLERLRQAEELARAAGDARLANEIAARVRSTTR